jgi:hypothetical protein
MLGGEDNELNQYICPPEDYILWVCISLVPSGPR